MREQRALRAMARLAAAESAGGAGAALAGEARAGAARAGTALAGAARMRAWRLHAYGGLRELRLEDARVPPLRAPADVLVRVRAASLNPIDVAMIGGYGARALNTLRALEGAEGVEFPLVPGRDFCGVVERAGPAARLRAGERVWGVVPPHRQGSHAEFVVVKDEWAGRAPRSLEDAAAGGALYAALTACAALRAGALRAGEAAGARVLLLGLGGVGQAALQLLAARGAAVTVGAAPELAATAARLGAAAALDRHAPDYERQLEAHGPYDVVLDTAGLGGDAAAASRWQFSRYVTLTTPLLNSMESRGVAVGALCAGASLLAQCVRAATAGRGAGGAGRGTGVAVAGRGASGAGRGAGGAGASVVPPHVRWAFFSPSADDIEHLRRLTERGQFNVFVEGVFPWWKAQDAFERCAGGSARGKLVLDFSAAPPSAATQSATTPLSPATAE